MERNPRAGAFVAEVLPARKPRIVLGPPVVASDIGKIGHNVIDIPSAVFLGENDVRIVGEAVSEVFGHNCFALIFFLNLLV